MTSALSNSSTWGILRVVLEIATNFIECPHSKFSSEFFSYIFLDSPRKVFRRTEKKIQSTYVVSLHPNENREVLIYEVSLRRGICGFVFLWLSTSRSQVVIKKSTNDTFFYLK